MHDKEGFTLENELKTSKTDKQVSKTRVAFKASGRVHEQAEKIGTAVTILLGKRHYKEIKDEHVPSQGAIDDLVHGKNCRLHTTLAILEGLQANLSELAYVADPVEFVATLLKYKLIGKNGDNYTMSLT